MSEQRQMLADTLGRLLADAQVTPRVEGFDAALWQQVVELGVPDLLVPEAQGGVGGDWDDAGAVLHALGYHAAPLPLGEAMLAAQLAAQAGLERPAGLLLLAPQAQGRIDPHTRRFTGTLAGVPWGRHAEVILALLPDDAAGACTLLLRRADAAALASAHNLAGEPRDTLRFDAAPVLLQGAARGATLAADRHALVRCAQIAGALESALHRSVEFARTRRQFGRAIGQFQAVQQQLAVFGCEVAAAACAARAACRAVDRAGDQDARFQIAAAKLRCNQAIGVATSIAHQVHGAIGFTREYDLRQSTQRLWSWRTEGGNDRAWSEVLGSAVCARGAANFWSDLTARDDPAPAPGA